MIFLNQFFLFHPKENNFQNLWKFSQIFILSKLKIDSRCLNKLGIFKVISSKFDSNLISLLTFSSSSLKIISKWKFVRI